MLIYSSMRKSKELLRRHWPILGFIFLVTMLKFKELSLPYFWDELIVYAKPAQWLYLNGLYRVLPGLHPPTIFFGHIPGFSWLVALGFKLFGAQFEVARSVVLALHLIQFIFTYRLGSLLGGRSAGIAAAAALFAIPTVFSHSTQVLSDPALASLVVAAVYYACVGNDRSYSWIAVLAALMKETSLAFSVPVFFVRIFQAKQRNELTGLLLIRYGLPIAAVFGFFLSEKVATGSFTNFPFTETLSLAPLPILERAQYYAHVYLWQSQNLSLLVSASALGAISIAIKGTRLQRWFLLFAVSIFVCFWLGISCFTAINARYFLPVFPFVCATAAGGLSLLMGRSWPLLAVSVWIWICVPNYHGAGSGIGHGWEENMQHKDMIEVHIEAAKFLEKNHPTSRIYAVWPIHAQLSDPFFGYVQNALNTVHAPASEKYYDLIVAAESSVPNLYAEQLKAIKSEHLILEKSFLKNGKLIEVWKK